MTLLAEARPSLVILASAMVAVPTLRYLLLRPPGRHNRPRRRAQTVFIIVVLMLSAALSIGAIGAGDTLRASFRTAIARNLGAIDETVTSTAALAGDGTHSFLPAQTADRLHGSLAAIASVVGALARPAGFPDRATHRTTAHGELLGVPTAYPAAFGSLATIQGGVVTLSQLGADQVYINQAAAQALGAHAGDRLQLLIGGQSVSAGPTTLYFAEGYTGQFRTNGHTTFEETLVLHNTTPFPATATLTYLTQDAHPLVLTRAIPPHGTLRESVNRDVGPDRSVATIVSSAARLTAQRLLRRLDAHGRAIGTVSAAGISSVGTMLAFPTSSARRSDQVYVALANPGPVAAQVSAAVTSHAGSSLGVSTQSVTVPAHGRTTLSLDHPAGGLRVTSDQPIAAEQVRYTGVGTGSAKAVWTITAGIPVAPNAGPAPTVGTGTPAAGPYAPVVRAVLRNQNLAAGGLLSGGAQAAPTVLLPLQRLQQVLGQPDQISVVLVANQGDPPARARLTGQVTSAIQSLLANTDAAATIKLALILPRGQDALQALQQDGRLAAGTQARLRAVQAELAVPGTSDRLKSLLDDSAVIAALRTITDPAVTGTLDPALTALSSYTVLPVTQDGLIQADRVGGAVAARLRDWGRIALVAGILLSVVLFALLPIEGRAGGATRRHRRAQLLSRSYASDVGATLLGVALGSAVGLGVMPSVAARVSADVFVLQTQSTARGVDAPAGRDELALTMMSPPAHTSTLTSPLTTASASPAAHTTTPTNTPTSTATNTPTSTATPTNSPTRLHTSTAMPTSVSISTSTPITTPVPRTPITTPVPGTPASTALPSTPASTTLPSTPIGTSVPSIAARTPTRTSAPARTPTPTRSSAIAIDSGGGAVGSFLADQDVSGGKTSRTTGAIDTRGVTNPGPQAVYQTSRYGNFTYTVPNLTPRIRYTVRLHFAETYWGAAGKRVFDVAINNTLVLRRFDIYAAAGGTDRAIVKAFTATASSRGIISITYTSVVDNAKSSGLEIIPVPTTGVSN